MPKKFMVYMSVRAMFRATGELCVNLASLHEGFVTRNRGGVLARSCIQRLGNANRLILKHNFRRSKLQKARKQKAEELSWV